MSTFQIVVLIWLVSLTLGLVFTFYLLTRWVAFLEELEAKVTDLQQQQTGNPFVNEGLRAIRESEGGQDG